MTINVWGTVGGVAGFIPMSALTGAAGQLLGMDATATLAEWKAAKVLGNQLILPVGAVGAPSLSWNDLTSGFYRPAADQVALSIAGVQSWLATATLHLFGKPVQFGALAQENQAADAAAVNGVTDLSAIVGNYVYITNAAGAKAITGWSGATIPAGTEIETKFVITGGSLSLTHDAAAFIILGGANFSLLNGDVARWRKISDVAANWEMVGFQRGLTTSGFTAKGDLLAGTLSGGIIVQGIRSVGSDGQVLSADSSQNSGTVYVDNPARPNLLVNPNWQIDQLNVGALVTINASGINGPDGWSGNATGAGVFKIRTLADPDNAALSCLEITCTTADAAIAAADNYFIYHKIEGYDASSLMLGTASAQTFILQFKFKSNIAGVYGVAFQNSAGNRRYIGTITVADAAEHEYSISLTGDTAGTWLYTNGAGLVLILTLAAGTNFQAAAGAWGAGAEQTTAAQANFMSNVANIAYLKRIQLLPGSLVQAYRAADFQKELAKAQRYFQAGRVVYHGDVTNTGGYGLVIPLSPTMRAAPTITWSGVTGSSVFDATDPTINTSVPSPGITPNPDATQFAASKTATGTSGDRGWSAFWRANARLS